jgi:hypothetical protein
MTGSFVDSEEAVHQAGGVLHFQWMRACRGAEFEAIPRATGVSYKPTLDVRPCLSLCLCLCLWF